MEMSIKDKNLMVGLDIEGKEVEVPVESSSRLTALVGSEMGKGQGKGMKIEKGKRIVGPPSDSERETERRDG